jgi:hypothetical protein
MIDIVNTQSALIQWMKANAILPPLVPSTFGVEIRELEWRGDKFKYPNIRVRVKKVTPEMSYCNKGTFEAVIVVASEEYSSLECNTIAGKVLQEIHGKSMNITIPPATVVKFLGIAGEQLSADFNLEANIWVSIINLSGGVS